MNDELPLLQLGRLFFCADCGMVLDWRAAHWLNMADCLCDSCWLNEPDACATEVTEDA